MSASDPKPIGSGYFSCVTGVAFLFLFVGSYLFDFRSFNPYVVFQCWLLFAATILTIWGSKRIAKVRQLEPKNWEVGQSTLNFVVGVIAATVAIFTFVLGPVR